MTMQRVVVLDDLAEDGLQLLEAAEGVEFDVRTGLKGEELRETLSQYHGAICRSGVKLTADVLKGNRTLRVIARAGVGTDNIDKVAATREGIVVMNTPAGNTLSTAEHTMALMLALSRNVAPANQGLIEGRWDRKKYMGTQLAGKTLGVVGLGRIGQAVAQRARAFDMQVMGFDPFLSQERAEQLGVTLIPSVEELLPQVDYLTVHTPLTDETRDLIDEAALEVIKPGCRLVNCARGGIYNEAALVKGLKSGKIAGVALDVYENEPCTDSPLFGMPGVIATPHLGASTEEAQTQVAVEAVGLVLEYLHSGAIRHSVNVAPLDPKTVATLRGYLDVSYRLGIFMAGFHQGGIQGCRLTYRGELANQDTKVLTATFAAGLLKNVLEQDVNVINAEVLLAERGIGLSVQTESDKGAFRSSMMAEITADQGSHRAMATLFGEHMPRLVELDGYRLEAFMDGCLLVFRHQDVPGIIGTVGTIFGKHDINIAQMAVGRAGPQPGGSAVGILNLDCEPNEAAIQEVQQHPALESAEVIRLPAAGDLPPWLAT